MRRSLGDVSKDAQAAVASLGSAEGTVEQVTSRMLCTRTYTVCFTPAYTLRDLEGIPERTCS